MKKKLDENRIRITDSLSTAESQGAEKMRVRRRPILLCLDELRTASPSKTANLICEAVRRTVHQTRRDLEFNEPTDMQTIERAFTEEIARWQQSQPLLEQGDHFFIEAITPNYGIAGDQIAITLHAKPDELHDLVVEYLDDTGTVLGSSDMIITDHTVSTDTWIIRGTTAIPYLDCSLEQATVHIRIAAVWTICVEVTGVVQCITIYVRQTESVPFEWTIGVPQIDYFSANGESGETVVYPGKTFRLDWGARYLNKIDIIRISNQGPDVDYHDNFSSVQQYVVSQLSSIGPFTEDYPIEAEYELTASNSHSSVSATVKVLLRSMPDLSVHGVEITQAIQYYRSGEHLTDPMDIQPDNSIPLIEGKEAWVRVYLRSGQDPNFDSGLLRDVGGQVEVYSPAGSSPWTRTAVLDPIDPSASIPSSATHPAPDPNHTVHASHDRDYRDERGDIGSTLNFLIPADAVTAPMIRLKVDVSAKTSGPGTSATKDVQVAVVCTPPLRIRAVLVEYWVPDPPPPTFVGISPPGDEIATIEDLLSYTRAIFPIRDDVDIAIAGTVILPFDLNDAPNCDGCCTNNWLSLNRKVADAAASDGNHPDWLYYGFVPTEAGGQFVNGCASGPVASGIVGSQFTLAHELGHVLGLIHAPFGDVGNYDTTYPAYEPYEPIPMASIGEFGFDIRGGGEVKPPAYWVHLPHMTRGFRDFMSYENPNWRWISLWNFWLIFTGLCQKLGNSSGGGGSSKSNSESTQFIPRVYISGMITKDGQFDVRCLFVLETGQVPTKHAIPDVYVVLLDKEDKLVAEAPLIAMPSYGGCGESTGKSSVDAPEMELPMLFQSTVPYSKDAVTVQIQRRGKVVWERRGIRTSKLELTESKSTKSNKLNLAWRYKGKKRGEPETWVRWSEDGGKTWNGLAVGIKESTASLRIDHLPKGEIVYQILTSDGFNTASVTTDPIAR